MNNRHGQFILLALSLILFSSLAGGLFAFSVEHQTLLKLREQYESAFVLAAERKLPAASAALDEAAKLNYRYVRIIDAHTHIIKLATLLLLLSLLLPILPWQQARRSAFIAGIASGSIVFPASVFMQIYVDGLLFKVTAAIGALLIIASMCMLLFTLFRSPAQPKQTST